LDDFDINQKVDVEIIEERLRRLNPAPVRERIPVLIGGGGEKVTLRVVAEHAHIWASFGDPQERNARRLVREGRAWTEGDLTLNPDPAESDRERRRLRRERRHAPHDRLYRPDYVLSPLEELIAWRDSRNGG
jgi:alkanesulfonate monooxygenase SsuD/methylene tetrahydromethanopterin reductase-like flavin-dependent oxidoreductase (luciferase family)